MALWILVPIVVVLIAVVIAFPFSSTHRRLRNDNDLAAAEHYLQQIGKPDEDEVTGPRAAPGQRRPASEQRRPAPEHRRAVPEQDRGAGLQERDVSAGSGAPRGRHAAPGS
jgi:hypothetical protein